MSQIRKILGTAAFGGALNDNESHKMLEEWSKLGYKEIDTAIMYQYGESEKVIGRLPLCQDPNVIQIACKVNPTEGFRSDQIVRQFNESLANLNVTCVNICYLHLPDHNIPIEETLKGIHQLHQEGKFKEFGLSNYASWEVVDIYHICKANGYVLPTVYQGMYNALTRDVEIELIPALRKFGMRFYVYNPLAGGMMSGKYNFDADEKDQPKGRFFGTADEKSFINDLTSLYRARYWRECYKTGIQQIQEVLNTKYNGEVPLYQAALRWLVHHSCLQIGDGVILGISNQQYFEANIQALDAGPLDEDIVKAFEMGWDKIKSDCPKYHR